MILLQSACTFSHIVENVQITDATSCDTKRIFDDDLTIKTG